MRLLFPAFFARISPTAQSLLLFYSVTDLISDTSVWNGHAGEKYKVQTRDVVVDFNEPSEKAFEELKKTAEELEISVLSASRFSSLHFGIYG